MRISRENYEEWMIDFVDGNLSPADEAEVHDFLELNPDVREELEEFENIVLEPENIPSYEEKLSLKKSDPSIKGLNRNEYLFIKKTENLLTKAEQKEYETLLSVYPNAGKEQALYDKTVLKPDADIVYTDKNKLKRVTLIPFMTRGTMNRVAAVAILILLFAVSLFTLKRVPLQPEKDFAEVQEQTSKSNVSPPVASYKVEPKEIARYEDEKKQTSVNIPSETNAIQKTSSKEIQRNMEKDMPVPVLLSSKGINDVLKPVELNGYEIALDQIMPLYIAVLREQDEKPVTKPSQQNEQPKIENNLLAGSIKVINKLTGNFVNIHNRYDDKGELVAYSFTTPNLRIDHKVKKGE